MENFVAGDLSQQVEASGLDTVMNDENPITIDGNEFRSICHYFICMKFSGDEDIFNEILMTRSARIQKQKHGKYKESIRDDWKEVERSVMAEAVKAKYEQYEDFKLFIDKIDTNSLKINSDDSKSIKLIKRSILDLKISDDSPPNEEEKDDPSTTEPILFYGRHLSHFEFSNFYSAPFYIDSKEYPTSEHYFQSMKFYPSYDHMESVRLAKSPGVAARLGRSRKNPLRKDWEEVKDDVMRTALEAKFTQNEGLKEVLLETGTREIIEHTGKDFYWGDGGDGGGKNMLGILLMELREKLRE
ncbi:unnamed protein product [Moneuplotes crassus]|uniref:NADAR domain-containing protein n=1 Tax=Euplotes crassus TaxID=5936 RepID=A0AAD1XJE7_EUPCR|nr:unnamed protein product [Moneuplotes crassus]